MPAIDNGPGLPPYRNAAAVTPHDTNELTNVARALYIGTTLGAAGTIKVTTVNGQAVTFVGNLAGTTLDVAAKIVWSTGTTSTNIVALW